MYEPIIPNPNVLCVEEGCTNVAHWRRPLTERVGELICDEHADQMHFEREAEAL